MNHASYAGNAEPRFFSRLEQEMNKHVRGRGKVIHIVTDGPGTGWAVVFDTEHAALKAFHVYRLSPGIRFGESKNMGGWYIST